LSQLSEWQKQQLLARSRFIGLRLKTEADIIKVYERSAARVAKEIEALKVTVEQTGKYKLELASKQALANALAREIRDVQQATSVLMRGAVGSAYTGQTTPLYRNLQQALESGGAKLDFVKMQAGFAAFDSAAVEAIWARVGKDGLTTSARIWQHATHYGQAMSEIVVDGVARGRDVVDVARDLTKYVQRGKSTLAEHYPNMMGRVGRRIPKDVCYEALRLARTELTAAAMEGTYAAGTVNPAYEGVDWVLSEAHTDAFPCACATLAAASPHKKGEEPTVPHPNCLCHVRPRVKDREAFVKEISAWVKDPSSSPEMEKWYKEIYTPMVYPGMGTGVPIVAPVLPSTSQPKPQEFKTIKDVEKWVLDNDIADNVSFKGATVDVALEWSQSIQIYQQRYPELRNNFRFIGTTQERQRKFVELYVQDKEADPANKSFLERIGLERFREYYTKEGRGKVGKTPGDVLAYSNYDSYTSGISINSKYANGNQGLKDIVQYNVSIGYYPKNVEGIKHVVTHEIGHQIDRLLDLRNNSELQKIIRQYKIGEDLSVYAKKSIAEVIAEAWSEYNNSPSPRKLALEIGNLIESEYTRIYGGSK
jgi:hypothetical protein